MPIPEFLPEIVETRGTEETCSQFVFGAGQYYVDEAYRELISGGGYRSVRGRGAFPQIEGDIVFYGSPLGEIGHVAKVDRDGLLVSKFCGNPNVYRHEVWGDPIPFEVKFEMFHLFRRRTIDIPSSSNP